MIELHPRPDALDLLGLPAIPYPVALPAFQSAVANDGELPLVDMLRGLQRRAAAPDADWQRLAPAMARLAELIAGDDARERIELAGEGWWLELAGAGMEAPALTLQRDGVVLAAIAGRTDGRLRACAYHPLDAAAIGALRDLAASPASGEASCWERACALAAARPDASGDGVDDLHALVEGWPGDPPADARAPACVAAEISACLQEHAPRCDTDAA